MEKDFAKYTQRTLFCDCLMPLKSIYCTYRREDSKSEFKKNAIFCWGTPLFKGHLPWSQRYPLIGGYTVLESPVAVEACVVYKILQANILQLILGKSINFE